MQWNKTPGPVEIHVTALKEQARAGIISTQYLSETSAATAGGEGVFTASHGGHKWLWVTGVIAVGAIGAGAAFFLLNKSSPKTTSATGVTVGGPTVIVGQ